MPTCFFSAPQPGPVNSGSKTTTARVALARSDNDVSPHVSHVHAEKIDICLTRLVCVASSADYDSSVDANVKLATTPTNLPVSRQEVHDTKTDYCYLFVYKVPVVYLCFRAVQEPGR